MIERYGNTLLALALIFCAALAGASSAWPQAWVKLPSPATSPTPDLFVPHFVTPDRGYLGGEISGRGVLYLTTDAGGSWGRVVLPGSPKAINDIDFPNSSTGIAAGDGSYLAISTDGGRSWIERSVPTTVWPGGGDIQGVHFKDHTTGVVVGRGTSGTGYRMARTSNGGATWVNVPMTGAQNNLYDVDFFDERQGIVVGTGNPPRKSVSTDGGVTWEPNATMGLATPPSLSFYSVDAIAGSSTAVAAGGMVVNTPNYPEVRKTTDGGATWHRSAGQPAGNKPLRGVIAITDSIYYVAGNGGTVHRTLDGGATWLQQTMPPGVTRDLRRFHRAADDKLYLVGYGGTLLRLQLAANAVFPQSSINFDKLCSGDARTVNLSVGNNGTSPLIIDSITVEQPAQPGVRFSVVSYPPSIAPGNTVNVLLQAEIDPKAQPGLYTGSIRVYNNDEDRTGADRAKQIALATTVTTKTLLVDDTPQTYAGATGVGTQIPFSIGDLLAATGECPVRIRSIYLVEGTDFQLAPPIPTTITSGQKGTIQILFTPRRPCQRYDTLVIGHDALSPNPDSLIRIPLSGTGLIGSLQTAPDDTVHFGSVVVGYAGTSTLTLFNTGLADSCLQATNLLGFRIAGPNADEFSTTFSIPPGQKVPIAPGGSLAIPLNAEPKGLGTRIAYAITTTDIPDLLPDTVVLMMKGLEPALTTAANEIRFTITDVGGRRDSTVGDFLVNLSSVTTQITGVRIIGAHASDFLYTGPTPTVVIPSRNKQSITVAFTPSATGLRSATLEFTTLGGTQPFTVSLLGNATRAVGGIRNPVALFPLTPINSCKDSILRGFIYNSGQVPLRITSTTIIPHPSGSPADVGAFTYLSPVVPPQRVIQPGDSASIELRFCPTEIRTYYARLLLGTNTGAGEFSVELAGTGRLGNVTLPAQIIFPKTRVMVERDSNISRFVLNTGAEAIRVDSIVVSGADASSFTVIGPRLPLTVPPGRDTLILLRFNPKRRGWHRGTLNIHTSTPTRQGEMQSVRLEGLGIYPFLEITPADPNAHRSRINTTRRLTILVRNRNDESSDTARIDDAVLNGSGTFRNVSAGPFPVRLYPGASVPIEVEFTPDRLCEQSADLAVRGEGVRGIYAMADTTVAITGIGTAPQVSTANREIDFGLRPLSSPTDSTLENFLLNIDLTGANGNCLDSTTVDSMVIIGADAASFSLLAPGDPRAPQPLAAGTFLPFGIRFLPTSPGAKSARLLVYFDGSGDSLRTIDLLGTSSGMAVSYGPFPNMGSINFGGVPLGEMRDSLLTIMNISAEPIVVQEIYSTSPDRMIVVAPAAPFTLLPGVSDTVHVRFAPGTAPGEHAAYLVLRSGSLSDSSFTLRGRGIASTFHASADSVEFGVHPPGSPADTIVMLVNETTPAFPDPSFLDPVLIDTVEIVAGERWYQVLSHPDTIPVGGRRELALRFIPQGVSARREGTARIYYNRRVVGSQGLRDSLDIALGGTVDGPRFDIVVSPGVDRRTTPGDTVHLPIVLSGPAPSAGFDSLSLRLGFRRTMLKPLEIVSPAPGVQGTMIRHDDPPGVRGMADITLISPQGFSDGTVCQLVCLVLLPDTLESTVTIDSVGVPDRPDIIFTTDSIRFMTTEFCDAQGRIIRFDTLFTFGSKPNPAARATVFEFTLPAVAEARLAIYDATGTEVMRLADGLHQPGQYAIPFDASALASGSYYCVLSAGRFSKTLILQVLQ